MKLKFKIFIFLTIIIFFPLSTNAGEYIEALFTPYDTYNFSFSDESLSSEIYQSKELLSVQHVLTNLDKLGPDTEEIEIQLTPYLSVTAIKLDTFYNEQGGLIWNGSINFDGEVTLALFKGRLSGTVRLDDRQFEISSIDNMRTRNNRPLHEIVEIDLENQLPDHSPDFEESLLITKEAEELYENIEHKDHFHPMGDQSIVPESHFRAAATIRVIVAYTSDTPSSAKSKIQQAVSETNSGFSSSGINARVQLAHVYQTKYKGSGNHGRDLNRFHKKGDGYMDEIFSKRKKYRADIAILVINKASACGRARAIGASASTAFCVVKLSCATGYYSFGHEIGHLLSARHNPEKDSKTSPYRYGHGYCYPKGKWRTIMSYNTGCKSRKNFWSDPKRSYKGVPRGNKSKCDNSRVLRITTPKAAKWL